MTIRKRSQKARPQKSDRPAGLAQTVDSVFGLGGKGSHHHENQLCIVSAVGLNCFVGPSERLSELFGNLCKNWDSVQSGQMGLVTEVRIWGATEDHYSFADRRASAETYVLRVEKRQEASDYLGIGDLHRLPGEGEIEAIHVYDDRKPHLFVLCQPEGHEDAVEYLLARGAVNLEKTTVARHQDIIVVRLQGDGGGQTPRYVNHDKRDPPAGYSVKHLHPIEQSLAGRCGECTHTRGCGCASSGDHRMLGLKGHHPAIHLADVNPIGDGFDDLCLGGDGKGRHVVNTSQTYPPGRGAVSC